MNVLSCDNLERKENFVYRTTPEIIKISNTLEQEAGIRFLSFATFFKNDGTIFTLESSWTWFQHYMDRYLDREHRAILCRKPGINYWQRYKNIELSEASEYARDNLDIDARISFTYEDKANNNLYEYSFCSDCKSADKAYRFYDMHRAKLLKFISYFNNKAKAFITDSAKVENRIQIPNYTLSMPAQAKRDYANELTQENASFELKDREFEILILYANGCNSSQIAESITSN